MKKIIFLLCMGASIANGVGVNNEISSDFLELENRDFKKLISSKDGEIDFLLNEITILKMN